MKLVFLLAASIAAGCTTYDRPEVIEWRGRITDRVSENSEEIDRIWEALGQGNAETAQVAY